MTWQLVPTVDLHLSKAKAAILRWLQEEGEQTTSALCTLTERCREQVVRACRELQQEAKVAHRGGVWYYIEHITH